MSRPLKGMQIDLSTHSWSSGAPDTSPVMLRRRGSRPVCWDFFPETCMVMPVCGQACLAAAADCNEVPQHSPSAALVHARGSCRKSGEAAAGLLWEVHRRHAHVQARSAGAPLRQAARTSALVLRSRHASLNGWPARACSPQLQDHHTPQCCSR